MYNKNSKNRIQTALINYLQKHGKIDLLLPDGVVVELGITQDSKNGTIKDENYCWVATQRDDRKMILDRYSMIMSFDEPHCLVESDGNGLVSVV